MKKRFLSLFIAVLTLFSLSACSSPDTTETKETGSSAPADSANAETVPELSEEELEAARMKELLDDVPDGSYNGYAFTMLNNTSNFAYTMLTAEAITGEGINDAIYNRNLKVADALKITVQEKLVEPHLVTNEMKNAIQANDPTYDCFWNESHFIAPFAVNGELLNIHDITPISLDKPWWNGRVLEEIQMGDYQYFLVGDLHLMFKESFWMVGFNKNLLEAGQLLDREGFGDPYALVRDGKWTLDRMAAFMQEVATDLNGDAVMDADDQFGATCYNGCVVPFFIGTGETFIERDEQQIPRLTTPDDRYYQAYEAIVRTMFAPEVDYVCCSGVTKGLSRFPDDWHGMFRSGQALFYLEPIGSLKKLRDMDAEFGIVPFPKLDEEQENYHSYIAGYAAFCGVPIHNADPQRTGVILENLAAQSFGDLRQAYVDTTLNFKYIRDKESREMLDLIFETGRLSLTDSLSVKVISDEMIQTASSGTVEFASRFKRIEKVAVKMLDRNIGKLLKTE